MSLSDASPVAAVTAAGGGELQNLFQSIGASLRQHEESIRSSFAEGLKRNGDLSGIPDHVRRQFEVWEATFTGTEERKLVEALKRKVTDISLSNEAYVRDQAQQKTARFQLELAMRAANKSVSGIQQLLSSQ
jgi:hypothetical protein